MQHKIPVVQQPDMVDAKTYFYLIKHTPVSFLPNGIIENKNADIGEAYLEQIDLYKTFFITPCNNFRHNNVFFRQAGKSNLCLMVPGTLTNILAWLPKEIFIQIHNSYIINRLQVNFISPHTAIHINDFTLPIGRKYAAAVDTAFLAQRPLQQQKSHHKKH